MTKIPILTMKQPTFSTSPHNTRWRHTRVSLMEVVLTKALIVKQGTRLSMSRFRVTIKILVMTNIHMIYRVSRSSFTVVNYVEVLTIALIAKLGTRLSMSILLMIIMTHPVLNNLHNIQPLNHFFKAS